MRKEVEHLYDVFRRYRLPARLDGCPCCTSSTAATRLLQTPLHSLDAPELEHYAFKALTTWGTLTDYKYFLPRIVELTDTGVLLCDVEVTLGKFAYGGFRDWSTDEQDAVRAYIVSAWRDAVRAADTHLADSVMCGAALLLDDASPLLEQADTIAPDFRSAYRDSHSNQTKRKLLNSYWDGSTTTYRQVVSWVFPEK